jgi:Protein of unknown function DUF262
MTIAPLEIQDEALLRRPEARAFKIEDLMAELLQGRVRVPEFQRPVKWERKNAHQLLDSIYRGYPVGTLLLWENEAPAAQVNFGSVKLSAPARPDAYWIVDGQQRIMSLARTLMAPSPSEDEFAAYFDLDEARFVPPPKPVSLAADPSRWFPLTEALDSERLLAWLFAHASDHKLRRERAAQLGKRIREYDIPVYIVRTDKEQVLRDVFNRANSTGVAMKEHEVFEALHGSRSGSNPSSIRQINAVLGELEFGRVDEKNLYRLLRVLQGEDVSDRAGKGTLRLSTEQAETAYRQTAAAASAAIQFLKQDCGIPHYELLPYKQPFVALGKFFHLHPSPSVRSRELLVRWLWRGALNGTHLGDTVSTRTGLDRIVAGDEVGSVQRLLAMVSASPTQAVEVKGPFKFSTAASKLLTLALLDLNPLDLLTGKLVRFATLLSQAQDDLALPLPQIVLPSSGSTEGLYRSAANRLIQPAQTGIRRALLQASHQHILASHGISAQAREALLLGELVSFLELRAVALQAHASSFFERKARWQESDRPPMTALLVEDEEA